MNEQLPAIFDRRLSTGPHAAHMAPALIAASGERTSLTHIHER